MTESPTRVVDTTYYSEGFPVYEWDQLITRTNYISQIEDGILNGLKLFFLEGEEDSGKTTLAAQFTRKHPTNTVSIFFNPLNNLDYEIDYFCRNAVQQISFLLRESSSDENTQLISTEKYKQSLYHLRKFIKKSRIKINLVIDGLEERVKEDPDFIRNLFGIVPFGEEYFTIIISGNKADFVSAYPKLKREDSKSVSLAGFSDSEAIQFLGVSESNPSSIRDLYKVTKGYPGRLKTLRRLIKSDEYSLENISNNTSYNSWLELDCYAVDFNSPGNNVILSLLSLTENSFSKEDVAKICSLNINEVDEIISSLPIVEKGERYITITSNAHKKYLSNILRANKSKIDEILIAFYAENESLNSLRDLPKLYSDKKEWGKVIQLLDDQYLNKILESTGSLKIVNETLELGVNASEKSNRYPDLLRYSLQGSIVNELDNFLFWESEIEARISIRDFTGAIALAESAVILVDRLRLLALIARRQKEFNDNVDEVLINLIQELYNSIDLTSVGEKIYDIVANLIYALPNMAMEMIEKSSSGVATDNSINDWMVAKLSIAAIESNLRSETNTNKSKRIDLFEGIDSPLTKKINRAISFLVGNYSAKKVLEEVTKIVDPEEKLRLLRLWLSNTRGNDDQVEFVIDAALNEVVISSSQTAMTLDVLTELSSQLPHVKNSAARKKIYLRFKSIDKDLIDLGLAKKRFTYQLNILHAEYLIDRNKSVFTLNKILNEIEKIDDKLIQLDSYSETFSKLSRLSGEEFRGKINFVYGRIITLSESLFTYTASHYKISQHFLKTIGKVNPQLALKIIRHMNNLVRREQSRLLVLDSYLNNNLKYIRIDVIKEIESDLETSQSKEYLYEEVLDRYSEAKSLHFNVILMLMYYYEKVTLFSNITTRLGCLILVYKIILKNDDWKNRLEKKIESQIYSNWKSLEADWEKIDQGFTICYELAKFNPTLSKKLFNETENLKQSSWIDSKLVAFTYLYSIKIVLKAYSGLLSSSNNTDEDYRFIEDLISRVPSQVEKLRLWTEVGFYAHENQREDVLRKISNDHILLILHDLIEKKTDVENSLDTFTLVHTFNPGLVTSYLKKLNDEMRRAAINCICDYYVTKQNPFEVYDQESVNQNSSFNDLTKAVSVLSLIDTDNEVYYLLDHICKAILTNDDLVKTQISTLAFDLKNLIETKFPDNKNIKHEGFKIISELKLSKVQKPADSTAFYETLMNRAKVIPNVSDSIFVNSILLNDIPFDKINNGQATKKLLYESITKALDSLPVHYEFVDRVNDISSSMYQYDRTAWKKYIEKAFDLSSNLQDGSDIYASQRNIIDSMYRIDPLYAKDLIKQLDKEKGKTKIKKMLYKHYEILEMADKIKNSKSLEQKEKENARNVVASVYMALKGLNSERIGSKKISEISTYLSLGSKLPLHEVFPVYMYYMNNCARTYKSVKDGSLASLHRDNFKEAIRATNLIQILSQKRKVSEKSYRKFFIDEEFSSNKPVRPKTREMAFNFIKSWLVDEAESFIIIADPFFAKEDLEILKLIKESKPGIDIDILGSKDSTTENIEEVYQTHWKIISDEEPPFVNVTFCRMQTDNGPSSPFHDRWIISKNGGLRLGTSINSLGSNKESEISVMKPNEALRIHQDTLSEYISRRKKELDNNRIYYKSFSL